MNQRFLIVHLACFGDCLFATTIAKQIKHDCPDSHITWAIAAKYKSILELNPHVDSVWEVPISDGDYYNIGWKKIEKEALQRKANGKFDEIIFSQIDPLNLKNFNGTIRGTILSTYKKPITVSVAPVVRLSRKEVENVKAFAAKNKLENFKNAILFECAPGSGQSGVSVEFALDVAKKVTEEKKDVCFLLSSNRKLDFENDQIIDVSELTFRENAELTKYCTLLIGCSSGITWLSTSDWAKKLPTLQLLSDKSAAYAGIDHDFKLNGLHNGHVIEMINYDAANVVTCIFSILSKGITNSKIAYHQIYRPNYFNLESVVKALILHKENINTIYNFARMYVKKNKESNNPIQLNCIYFIQRLLYLKIRSSQNIIVRMLKKIKHACLKQNLHVLHLN
jgi:ADP-heptose:LPS heptosyltransferase